MCEPMIFFYSPGVSDTLCSPIQHKQRSGHLDQPRVLVGPVRSGPRRGEDLAESLRAHPQLGRGDGGLLHRGAQSFHGRLLDGKF